MTVNLKAPESLLAISGVKLAAIASGIKKKQTKDLVLISFDSSASCAAVFTKNRFRAAPVIISEKNLASARPIVLMINSGNANAGTGDSGYQDALKTCELAAAAVGCEANQVLPFSTGVIGENLPLDCFEQNLPKLNLQLSENNWMQAAEGIMTTDTVAKGVSKQIQLDGETVTITGISKGSGMIKPNMATMLGFVATDATIDPALLKTCLQNAVDQSFNAITVDGDTSTNDSCVLIASGGAPAAELIEGSANLEKFVVALNTVMLELAQSIIRDGEGATKFVEVKVLNASSVKDAKEIAYTVAHSPLVKTALFASDPNWGRILAAVGRADIDELDIDKLFIHLDDVCIVENGGRANSYTEEAGQQVMSKAEIVITVDLNAGSETASVWTSDLSYDYVKINAEYRT